MSPSRVSPPPSAGNDEGLTPEQLSDWNNNGYLIIPDALSQAEVASLLQEANDLLGSFSLSDHPMTRFSTGESSAHVGDDYFLTSGDKIRFFFEEDAFSPGGELLKPKERAINKIGHYLHALSPPFRTATLTKANAARARALGFRDPRCLQSMVICKQPEIGGRVPPHQDSTFLYTNPPSAVGFWYALEDCTVENGCLSFAKGSHRRAPVKQRFVRSDDGKGTTFIDNEDAQWPKSLTNVASLDESSDVEEQYTLAEVKAGTLVMIHGNILHKSEKNTSQKGRMIYTFHVIEADGADYDIRNWLQSPDGGFTKL